MTEIDAYELEVLGKTLFPERYDLIIEECNMDEYIARDCLRSLVRKKLMNIMIRNNEKGTFERRFIYDTDTLENYYFQATSEGISFLEKKK